MDDTFFYFVYGFGNVERLFEFHWAFDIPSFDAAIGLIVQGVYCWRIWVLSRWKFIPLFSFLVGLLLRSRKRRVLDKLEYSGFPHGWSFWDHCRNSSKCAAPFYHH